MRKEWLWIGVIGLTLTACTVPEQPQSPPSSVYSGPVEEIGGVEPRYEPYNPGTQQDYRLNGRSYKIVANPVSFSETGLATWYGAEASGNRTAIGEVFDPNALTAAHPTLPIPSYVRVTNLSNGRRLVVRVNDRGPYTPGRIIDLSKAAAERLNISNNTRVKVDFIQVAPDGTLSGPGAVGTTVAKQSFALPDRPNLSQGSPSIAVMPAVADNSAQTGGITQPAASSGEENASQPLTSPATPGGGFLGAPSALPAGVLEGSEPAPAAAPQTAVAGVAEGNAPAASGGRYLVQVGALSDAQRAQSWLNSLSNQFHVPGKVSASGNLYRVQLGPFESHQRAVELQQRLSAEASQQSFITTL
ncbi:endolytic peptidoglycan transglycosylase RlpA [Affinibrenneria salicis]|uniref:Endolytic peptidoglycan transglycosylase RlpA n=1 Tax=Affinibrenneria salicis TaxID=2590031 RepID=A0A5J5G0U3_9GAMM|nr:endolytic peptidoglycan transglycosylase RlpA [Affinibrenneria salicis]KAA8999954.1 endolytic peptidoglycan transglycosylase RlpA [Affinibrenneria salicis]